MDEFQHSVYLIPLNFVIPELTDRLVINLIFCTFLYFPRWKPYYYFLLNRESYFFNYNTLLKVNSMYHGFIWYVSNIISSIATTIQETFNQSKTEIKYKSVGDVSYNTIKIKSTVH